MEAVERGLSSMVKISKPVDKGEKIALSNELKADRYGAKVNQIENGLSGKQLNLDGFKFDDKFGGKYQQPSDYGAQTNWGGQEDQNGGDYSAKNTNYGDSLGGNNNAFWDFPSNNQNQNQNQQKSKLGEKGFLDFDGFGGGSSQNKQQSSNPFG